MGQNGGARPGAGRKSKAEELQVAKLSIDAITEHWGGLKEGLIELLKTGEPALIKFVFEHAMGKPTDNVVVSDPDGKPIKQIIIINGKEVEF